MLTPGLDQNKKICGLMPCCLLACITIQTPKAKMATSATAEPDFEVSDAVELHLKVPSCTICFEAYRRENESRAPRTLGCGHSFCHSCLMEQRRNLAPGAPFNCATCRATQSHAEFPMNIALLNALDLECMQPPIPWFRAKPSEIFMPKLVDPALPLEQFGLAELLTLMVEQFVPSSNVCAIQEALQRADVLLQGSSTQALTESLEQIVLALRTTFYSVADQSFPVKKQIIMLFGMLSKTPAFRKPMAVSKIVDIFISTIREELYCSWHRNAIEAKLPPPSECILWTPNLPPPRDMEFQRALAFWMAHMACCYEARFRIIAQGGIRLMIQFQSANFEDNRIAIAVFSALADMCVSRDYQLAITSHRGLEHTIGTLMQRLSQERLRDWSPESKDNSSAGASDTQQNSGDTDTDVVRSTCRVLVNVGIAPENKKLLGSLGGIPLLLNVLRIYKHTQAKITFLATAALCNATALLSNCAHLAKQTDSVDLLLETLRTFILDSRICESTTGILCNASSDRIFLERFVAKGGLEVLLQCGRQHPNHAKIAEGICGAFASAAGAAQYQASYHAVLLPYVPYLENMVRTFGHLYSVHTRARTALQRLNARVAPNPSPSLPLPAPTSDSDSSRGFVVRRLPM